MVSQLPLVVSILFPLLFVGAVLWLASIFLLIHRLKYHHPETYHAMGEPRIQSGYTLGQMKALISDFMLILFVSYLVGFFVLLVSLMSASNR
jgi:hypothetical protein